MSVVVTLCSALEVINSFGELDLIRDLNVSNTRDLTDTVAEACCMSCVVFLGGLL